MELHELLESHIMVRRLKKDVSGGSLAPLCPALPPPPACLVLSAGAGACLLGSQRAPGMMPMARPVCPPPPAPLQVLDDLPDKIRKRIPIEPDPAHV